MIRTRRRGLMNGMGLAGCIGLAGCLLVVLLAASAGVADPQAVSTRVADRQAGVTIQLFQFRPGQLAVKPGTRVSFANQDDIEHTVTSGTPERRTGRFDARLPGKQSSTTVEFTDSGVYPYFCDRHPSMRGEVRVN
jgi:plastocyanin